MIEPDSAGTVKKNETASEEVWTIRTLNNQLRYTLRRETHHE